MRRNRGAVDGGQRKAIKALNDNVVVTSAGHADGIRTVALGIVPHLECGSDGGKATIRHRNDMQRCRAGCARRITMGLRLERPEQPGIEGF